MNWYKLIKISQIWETNSSSDFADELLAFYELEYKYSALKNYPFRGSPQRYQNILNKVEDSWYDTMENLITAMEESSSLQTITESLKTFDSNEKYQLIRELISPHLNGMFVTPKDIDATIKRIGFTVSEALNVALAS